MATIEEIIAKAAVTTSSLSNGGLLNKEQARKFIQQTFDATNLNQLVRHEMRTAKTGEIDKIGIARRIIRQKIENTDDGYRAGVTSGQIEYATRAIRLPWEITEETLRENIEGQSFESIVTNLMTTQLGIDLEDIYLNGDEDVGDAEDFDSTKAYAVGDMVLKDNKPYKFIAAHAAGAWNDAHVEALGDAGDGDFLKINDGWIKQIAENGHTYDASSLATMKLDIFYKGLQTIPNKYNNGKLRWLMSPRMAQEWELYLLKLASESGGHIPDNMYNAPARIPAVECPAMSDDIVLLTDPKNLIVVNTYDVKIRKTTEGEKAIMMDKRFYVTHLDYDSIIEETDATALIKMPAVA